LPWLSGTASWAYYTAAQYILGIQPEYTGLRIDPCIPSKWKEVKISRTFRNKNIFITIKNKNAHQKGVQRILLNGELIQGNILPADQLKEDNDVLVEL
jgi:cellobiose phosphorylase